MESDAIFRNRTKKFDGGVLINSLEIDKGLVIQLDSDLAEHCHLILEESIKRLPRKGADPNEMRMEIKRNKQRDDWVQGYLEILRSETKLSQIYGTENSCLQFCNMYTSSLQLSVPSVSAKLDLLKADISNFIDSNAALKTAAPIKIMDKKERKLDRKRRRENPEMDHEQFSYTEA